jgi:hypothetical protein
LIPRAQVLAAAGSRGTLRYCSASSLHARPTKRYPCHRIG